MCAGSAQTGLSKNAFSYYILKLHEIASIFSKKLCTILQYRKFQLHKSISTVFFDVFYKKQEFSACNDEGIPASAFNSSCKIKLDVIKSS